MESATWHQATARRGSHRCSLQILYSTKEKKPTCHSNERVLASLWFSLHMPDFVIVGTGILLFLFFWSRARSLSMGNRDVQSSHLQNVLHSNRGSITRCFLCLFSVFYQRQRRGQNFKVFFCSAATCTDLKNDDDECPFVIPLSFLGDRRIYISKKKKKRRNACCQSLMDQDANDISLSIKRPYK